MKGPGRWHNGSTFVLCPGDCLFESEPSPPLLMHVGNWPAALLADKRLACVSPEVDLRECTLHSPPQKSE